MVKRAVELEGTVTGEHGVGLIKRDYLPHELGESTVDAMRRVSSITLILLSSWSADDSNYRSAAQIGLGSTLLAQLRQSGSSPAA